MTTNQLIKSCLDDLKNIGKVELGVYDIDGSFVYTTDESMDISPVSIRSFLDSGADSQVLQGYRLFRVNDGDTAIYVVVARDEGENVTLIGRAAASEISHIDRASREKFDKNSFYQNLILDNLLVIDIYNKAKKLHIDVDKDRLVYIIEQKNDKNGDDIIDVIKGLFNGSSGDHVTAVDEKEVILVKSLDREESPEQQKGTAAMIVDMVNTEALADVRVSYGTVAHGIKEVSRSYKEARMAMDVGKIFYSGENISGYSELGVGRLIYQLPEKLCDYFLHEIFGDNIPYYLDEETLMTIDRFFENNLNVSETSRQLYVHRNTLVYRIERLMKTTGLDIRKFDDALTLKISLMVINYLAYLRDRDGTFNNDHR